LAVEGARFLFCVGVPYLALLTGAFAPRDVGLQGTAGSGAILGWTPETWARAIGQAAALGVATLVVWALLARQLRRAGSPASEALGIERASIAQAAREAVYAEAHWSLYRAVPMVWLGEPRLAALTGLVLVAVETLLAGRRAHLHNERINPFTASVIMLSATFFALTGGNAWLAVLAQIVVRSAAVSIVHAGPRSEDAGVTPTGEIVTRDIIV
jgi:hypothetical protein